MSKKEHHNLSLKMNGRPIVYPETCKRNKEKKKFKEETLQKYENVLFSDSSKLSFFSKNKEEWLQTTMEKYPGTNITLTNNDGSIRVNPNGIFHISGARLTSKFDADFREMGKKVSKMKEEKGKEDNISSPAKRKKRQEDPTTSNTQGGSLNEGGATSGLTNAKKRARPSDDDN